MATLNPAQDKKNILINSVMGLCGESGEAIDIVKKWLMQGHELDKEHLVKELGNVAWYLAEAASGEARLKSWFPVYEYTMDGVKHRVKAFVGTAKPEVKVGQTVELFVDPNCADDFYSPAEKMSCIQKVFVGVGTVCLCLTVIMLATLYTCA